MDEITTSLVKYFNVFSFQLFPYQEMLMGKLNIKQQIQKVNIKSLYIVACDYLKTHLI